MLNDAASSGLLLRARRPEPHAQRLADPVASFHLGNGAELAGLSWAGDLSGTGLRRSYGLMAHYCYSDFDGLEERAAAAREGRPHAAADLLRLAGLAEE